MKKLAVLVPPLRVQLVRWHGLFALNAKCRAEVVPGRKNPQRACTAASTQTAERKAAESGGKSAPSPRHRPSCIDWASLLKRIFKLDVLFEHPPIVEEILSHIRLPQVPLPTSPPRGQERSDVFAAQTEDDRHPSARTATRRLVCAWSESVASNRVLPDASAL